MPPFPMTFRLLRRAALCAGGLMLALAAGFAVENPAGEAAADRALQWDAKEKHFDARAEDNSWDVGFRVMNRGDRPVRISAVQPSCGCTVPQLPADPWIIAPGATSEMRLRVDFTSKEGELAKEVYVVSDLGTQRLHLTLTVPPRAIDSNPARRANVQLARADRQAVFRGDCARCHGTPTSGQTGVGLYVTACSSCHDSPHRASMVPELAIAKAPRDAAYWRDLVRHGRPGTLMPAFARAEGGPLSDEQVDSLVDYLQQTFPAKPPP